MMDLFVTATAKVRRMLDQGFQPLVGFRDRRWAHPDRGVADPITPPEGVVLDQLLYLDADTGQGTRHVHSYLGGPIEHTHDDGARAHQHHPGEDRPSFIDRGARYRDRMFAPRTLTPADEAAVQRLLGQHP